MGREWWPVASESEGRELAVRAEASKKAPKQSQIALALVFGCFALKTCNGEIERENKPNRHTLTEKPRNTRNREKGKSHADQGKAWRLIDRDPDFSIDGPFPMIPWIRALP